MEIVSAVFEGVDKEVLRKPIASCTSDEDVEMLVLTLLTEQEKGHPVTELLQDFDDKAKLLSPESSEQESLHQNTPTTSTDNRELWQVLPQNRLGDGQVQPLNMPAPNQVQVPTRPSAGGFQPPSLRSRGAFRSLEKKNQTAKSTNARGPEPYPQNNTARLNQAQPPIAQPPAFTPRSLASRGITKQTDNGDENMDMTNNIQPETGAIRKNVERHDDASTSRDGVQQDNMTQEQEAQVMEQLVHLAGIFDDADPVYLQQR